jgi:hypothetical protein
MQAGSDPIRDVKEAVCEGFRQIGDVSYAFLPKNMAHALGDLKKALLTELTTAFQWQMEWIDNRVAGGDKLREKWREKCERETSTSTSGPAA